VLAYKIPLTARYTGKVLEANMSLLSAWASVYLLGCL
jgi:hypothetical protein